MKQQLLIIACFLAHTCYADTLSDAIQANNLPLVSSLLQHNRITPKLGYLYISKADETIRICRERMLLFEIRPHIDPEYGTYATVPLLLVPILMFSMDHTTTRLNRIFPIYTLGALMSAGICLGLGFAAAKETCQQQYNDALKIKDLILEYYGNKTDNSSPSPQRRSI